MVFTTHIVFGTVFETTRPVDSAHVGGGHPEDVQFEGLLDEDEVVVAHAKAVVVAGAEEGTAGHSAQNLRLLQWGLAHFWWEKNNRSGVGRCCWLLALDVSASGK